MPMTLKGVHGSHLFDKEIPSSYQCDATLQERQKSDKKPPFLAFLFHPYHLGKFTFQPRVPQYG
jgi:hypothetical protein